MKPNPTTDLLARYARDTPDLDDWEMTTIELDPTASGGAHEGAVPIRWLEAYVRFDGWDWTTVAPRAYVHGIRTGTD